MTAPQKKTLYSFRSINIEYNLNAGEYYDVIIDDTCT